jgi:CRISPR/Cas system endoribonuclease Cas6 (RAMP superfamily)
MSIRAQSAAAVNRQNSSQDDNSLDEAQTISSQNSSADENLIFEDDQISSQILLSQNFSFSVISSSVIRQFIKSIFEDTEMSIINVHVKTRKIVLLNESSD